MHRDQNAKIFWPSAEERNDMEGTIVGFSNAVYFVDGTKVPVWKPHDDEEQNKKYDICYHMHFPASLVRTNI